MAAEDSTLELATGTRVAVLSSTTVLWALLVASGVVSTLLLLPMKVVNGALLAPRVVYGAIDEGAGAPPSEAVTGQMVT